MELEVKLSNPCVTNNRIVFRDSEVVQIEDVSLKATYSKLVIDLAGLLTDKYSRQNGDGLCGEVAFKLSKNIADQEL